MDGWSIKYRRYCQYHCRIIKRRASSIFFIFGKSLPLLTKLFVGKIIHGASEIARQKIIFLFVLNLNIIYVVVVDVEKMF